jgi:hypothetical protein
MRNQYRRSQSAKFQMLSLTSQTLTPTHQDCSSSMPNLSTHARPEFAEAALAIKMTLGHSARSARNAGRESSGASGIPPDTRES